MKSVLLFGSLCSATWLTQSRIILCFDKVDRLEEKLATSQVQDYYPEHDGNPTDVDLVKTCFCDKFSLTG